LGNLGISLIRERASANFITIQFHHIKRVREGS
jgi:hypothetical protein